MPVNFGGRERQLLFVAIRNSSWSLPQKLIFPHLFRDLAQLVTKILLKQDDMVLSAELDHFIRPDASLNFTNMGFPQIEHA